jgi:hypothetical protein
MGALKMIWQYKLGKPLPAPNPDMIDRDEWDHFQKDAMTLEEMKQVLGQLPSRIGNAIVSSALPSITSAISHTLAQQLLQGLPAEYLGNQSNGPSPVEPSPVAEQAFVASSLLSVCDEHPISNGDLPELDEDGLPVRPLGSNPLATQPRPIANGNLTVQPTGAAHASRPLAPAPHSSGATRPAPISNGKSKAAPGKKKGRKSFRNKWLDPVAKKCQATKKPRRQRVSA